MAPVAADGPGATLATGDGATPWWIAEFRPFTWQHGVVVGLLAALVAVWVRSGRRRRGTPAEREIAAFSAGACLAVQCLLTVYWLEPSRRSPAESWPLHLCDMAAFLAPAMLARVGGPRLRELVRALVVFWGFGLCTQAFISPTVVAGPESGVFWFYWLQHTAAVGAAVYAVAAMGYRPGLRDAARVVGVSLPVALLMAGLDAAFGLNYWYVGPSKPGAPTVLDALGAWPLRIVWVVLIASGVILLIGGGFEAWNAWRARRAGRGGRGGPGAVDEGVRGLS